MLPEKIYSVASVRNIDQAAIDDAGIGGYTLMMRAGKAAFDAAIGSYPDAKRWQVICGSGNNGGDGFVVARLAAEQGIAVSVLLLTSPDELGGDAATAYMDFAALGGVLAEFEGTLDGDADLLIDGMLGSGLERDVEGSFAGVVNAMNEHEAPVIALDIPSGLHGDTGKVMGVAVRASVTVTFVGLKGGVFLDNGPEHVGRLVFSDLEIPRECRETQRSIFRLVDDELIRSALPARQRSAQKGDFGHVLIVGGRTGMPGAVRICGEAALRSGAGLVSVATHPSHSALITAGCPELMCHPIESADDLAPLMEKASVIAVGPGLGTDDWAKGLLAAVAASELPVVADADALNLLADDKPHRDTWILTPHPGEAARLLESTPTEIQADRVTALADIREIYGGTVVLKGAGTLVSSKKGSPWLCRAGNPGMASPGMGDALTGIVASFRAQGMTDEAAAIVGVHVHAQAGDAAAESGERGMMASDLLAELRTAVNR